jgi:ABC-type dipeptide/oligopeptide/nickel transport system ATPase subunit
MTSNPPAVQQVGGAVLVQGQGLDQFMKCVLAQIRVAQRSGYSVEPYAQLLRTIHTARSMSANGHEFASYQVVESHSDSQDEDDWIDVAAAAELLVVSRRHVRRLAPSLSPGQAKRIGKSWALRKAPVLALAEQRRSKK